MGSSPQFTPAEHIAGFASWAFGTLVLLGLAGALKSAS